MFENLSWLDYTFATILVSFMIAYIGMEIVYKKYKTMPAPSSIPMRMAVIKALKEYIPLDSKRGKLVIVEPGAGWGALAIAAAKAYKKAGYDVEIRAYEVSHAVFGILWLRALFQGGRVKPIFKSFYDESFEDVDAILTYQTIDLLKALKPKMEKELPPHALVFCNTFYVDGWSPIETRDVYKLIYDFKVFIYQRDKI